MELRWSILCSSRLWWIALQLVSVPLYVAVYPVVVLAATTTQLVLAKCEPRPNWGRQLIGAELSVWAKLLARFVVPAALAGRMAPRHFLKVAYITLMVLALHPVNKLGRMFLTLQGKEKRPVGRRSAPVFVLGHYRFVDCLFFGSLYDLVRGLM